MAFVSSAVVCSSVFRTTTSHLDARKRSHEVYTRKVCTKPVRMDARKEDDLSAMQAEIPDDEDGIMQGPSQAPTEAGISTAGLIGSDATLLEASYKADVSGIENALADGADVNSADVNGRTSLHFCAGNGLQTLVRDLVSRGATIDKQDVLGYTPLHIAAGYRMVTTVRALIELGADANIASNDGKLPVETAEELLDRTPKKRFFVTNAKYTKLKEIVDVLDEATEVEEGGEDDDEHDIEPNSNGESRDFKSSMLGETGEKTEKIGDTTFVVRVKSKQKSSSPEPPAKEPDNVNVTIRVKKPDSSNK